LINVITCAGSTKKDSALKQTADGSESVAKEANEK
jgi:hypothetical protein